MKRFASPIVPFCLAAAVEGQQAPPRPAVPPTPVIVPAPDQRAPKPSRTPRPPRSGQSAEAPHDTPSPLWPPVLPPALAPISPLPPGQWSAEIEEALSEARWQLEDRRHEIQAALADRSFEIEQARAEGQRALEEARAMFPPGGTWWPDRGEAPFATMPPAPRRLLDQADSLYRSAREMLNRGEYRRAAAMFSDLSAKHANSAYAADGYYWQAFALYRIGGTQELRGALEALRTQQTRYPNARTQADGRTLATRIRGALAARGDPAAAAELRGTTSDSALRCDAEEQSVRAEALKAIIESDPAGSQQLLQRTLGRTDECSVRLRQTAIFMIGSKRRDAQGVALLSQAARNDPSPDVRASALEWLARMPGEDALGTIEAVARDTSDERIQRAAVRALVAHPSARARASVRGIVDRSDVPERLRLEALGAFTKERSTTEDVQWLRSLYGRTENSRIKSRVVAALTRIGGPEVDAWLLSVARNPEEDSETRSYAMRRIAETQPIAELGRLYDAAAQRSVRETLIEALAQRPEAEATDKLLEIVRTGTDPRLRSRAINALTRKKDPRTMQLLMELISK